MHLGNAVSNMLKVLVSPEVVRELDFVVIVSPFQLKFCSVLFSILFYSILFYSILFYSILFYSFPLPETFALSPQLLSKAPACLLHMP